MRAYSTAVAQLITAPRSSAACARGRPERLPSLAQQFVLTAPTRRWLYTLRGLQLSRADEQGPRDAVVMAVDCTKILRLLRL